jgi:DNA invertase Pin-like site-specific DNA recombinase
MSTTTDQHIQRAVIYTRVSSDKAKGRSVAEQEAECRTECERRRWPVADVLTDNDRSATRFATKDRPQYARLGEVLRPGDVLVVWEPSRAGRSLEHYVDLRRLCADRGVMLSYSGKLFDLDDGDDRFTTGLDALIAEREAEDARKRIQRAHRANLAAGRPHGKVSYGYRIVRDPQTGKSVGREPDPVRAPLLAEAARRVLDGHSFKSVQAWIECEDPSQKWSDVQLRRVLTSPTSAGLRTHRGSVTGPGTWEAILTEDQHNDLVAVFAARRAAPRGAGPRHLLSGIAVCTECGDVMWRHTGGKLADGSRSVVYTCRHRHAARSQAVVDAAVLAVIEGILASPEALAALATAPEEPASTATSAKADLAELERQLAAVEDKMTDLTMPADVGARVAARLSEQIEAAKAAATPVFADPVVRQVATAPDALAAWHGLPLTQQRDFIRAVLTIEIAPVGRGRWHAKEAGITVTPRRGLSATSS